MTHTFNPLAREAHRIFGWCPWYIPTEEDRHEEFRAKARAWFAKGAPK